MYINIGKEERKKKTLKKYFFNIIFKILLFCINFILKSYILIYFFINLKNILKFLFINKIFLKLINYKKYI